MRRREFVGLLGGAIAAGPLQLRAQTKRIPKMGVLWHGASAEEERVPLGHLQHGLRDLGYFEGQNIIVENRFPAEQPERFLALAKELAQLGLDVLIGVNRPSSAAVH